MNNCPFRTISGWGPVYWAVCLLALFLLHGCTVFLNSDAEGRSQDPAYTAMVTESLQNEPSLDMTAIKVETYRGVVQLTGIVDSPRDVRKAGDLAAAIPGIISVRNELVVQYRSSNSIKD